MYLTSKYNKKPSLSRLTHNIIIISCFDPLALQKVAVAVQNSLFKLGLAYIHTL